uniref:RING-type domain-containing protein n=1 Tax=Panthera leo TaxID=9689 RepID=A0A8C8XIL3_PANLE
MAGLDPGLAIPVWLAEDDLGCIICQGLLAWPATLPCGHSFCRDCLKGLWAAGSPGRRRSCPTCREGAAQPPQLRKNTLLQELADKYSRALRELKEAPRRSRPAAAGAAPEPARPPPRRAAQLPAAAQKSITEAGHELEELVEQLVDLVRSLQSQTHLPEPGPDNEGSTQSLWNSKKVHLPLHARCLTTVTLPPRGPPGLLSGPSVRPLTFGATAVVWRCPRTAGW